MASLNLDFPVALHLLLVVDFGSGLYTTAKELNVEDCAKSNLNLSYMMMLFLPTLTHPPLPASRMWCSSVVMPDINLEPNHHHHQESLAVIFAEISRGLLCDNNNIV